MSAFDRVDIGALTWVKGEIDLALNKALEHLARFSGTSELDQLRFCQTHLHQVNGAIQMVGLEGAARFSEEVEKFTGALSREELEAKPAHIDIIADAVRALMQYLDALAAGEADVSLKLFPVYKRVLEARGVERISETDLFFPELSARAPKSDAVESVSGPDLIKRVKSARMRYQKGLLHWLKTSDGAGLADMRDALESIERTQAVPANRTFWWAAVAFVESLAKGGVGPTFAVKQLSGRIDQQIRKLADGSTKVAERLLRDVLYFIARSEAASDRIRSVKQAFEIDSYLPTDSAKAPTDQAQHDKLAAKLRDLREAMGSAKEAWLKFTAGNADSLKNFADQFQRLLEQARGLDKASLVALLVETQSGAESLIVMPSKLTEAISMEVATALLLAENAFENYEQLTAEFDHQADVQIARLKAAFAGETMSSAEHPLLDEMSRKAQEKLLVAQVGQEIQHNLRHIESVLDTFFREPEKRTELSALAPSVKQVSGALRILDHENAAVVLASCNALIEKFAQPDYEVDAQEFELVAEGLSSLGFFIDSVQHGRANSDHLLNPILAKFGKAPVVSNAEHERQEEPAAVEEVPVSIEASVHEQKQHVQQLLSAWQAAPTDEGKAKLREAIAHLSQDADLIDNAELKALTSNALKAIDEVSETPSAETEAAVASLSAPKVAAVAPSAETAALVDATDDAIDAELLETYLEEAQEVLERVRENVKICDRHADDKEALTVIRRGFHTLKGSGRMVGLTTLGEIAWAVEQVLNTWLQEERHATPRLLDFIQSAHNGFEQWVTHLRDHGCVDVRADDLLVEAERLRTGDEQAVGKVIGATEMAPTTSASPDMPTEPLAPSETMASEPEVAAPQNLDDEAVEPEPTVSAIEDPLTQTADADTEIELSAPEVANVEDAMPQATDEAPPPDLTQSSATDAESDIQPESSELSAIHEAGVQELTAPNDAAITLDDIRLEAPENFEATEDAAVEPADDQSLTIAQEEAAGPDTAAEDTALTESSAEEFASLFTPETVASQEDALVEEPVADADPVNDAKPVSVEPELILPTAQSSDVIEHNVETPSSLEAAPEPTEVVIAGVEISRELFDTFITESEFHIAAMRAEFETSRHAETPVSHDFLRAAHTLCGIASTVGIEPLADLSYALERVTMRLIAHPQPLDGKQIKTVDDGIAALAKMHSVCAQLKAPRPAKAVQRALERMLQKLVESSAKERAEHGNRAALTLAPAPTQPAATLQPAAKTDPEASAADPHGTAETAAQPERDQGKTERRAESGLRDDIDEQLLPIFLEEAHELVPMIGDLLRTGRKSPSSGEMQQSLQRALHTLKGSARMAGAMRLGELTHNMETRLVDAIQSSLVDVPLFDELDAQFDHCTELVDQLEHGAPAPEVVATPTPEPTKAKAVERRAFRRDPEPERAVSKAVLRVRAELVDRLVNEAGEVSIARSRVEAEMLGLKRTLLELTENVIRLRTQLREIEIQAESQMQSRLSLTQDHSGNFDPLEFDRFTRLQELTRSMAESVNDVSTIQQSLLRTHDEAEAALLSQARMTRELQQELMHIRMVPVASIEDRLHRIVRQTCRELGKKGALEITGGDVELDRSVLEKMTAPFEHLLRNAVAHGLETVEQRRQAGKSEMGKISCLAHQEGNEVVLTISDDGAGLDPARIRQKGVEQGLVDPNAELSEAQLIELIFTPGFSTAQEVTQVSGRGIGMDVARNEIVGLGGRIEVASELGKGTTFRIYLPLTLAVAQAVLIRAGHGVYAIPSSMVEQVQELKPEPLKEVYARNEITWHGNTYPFSYLPRLFGDFDHQPEPKNYSFVLLLKSGTQRAAVHIDEMLGNQEIVVKNIGPQLIRVPGIAGGTVLGNGSIVLIINPVQLAYREGAATPVEKHAAAPIEIQKPQTAPTIMVVDDSLTVRKITGRLLTKEGFNVITAKDGVDALQQLEETLPDVMLVDIEMPRMDGFELTKNIRGDARMAHIPIIMITSRTAEKHRNYAKELGVNAYLGKPYQEEELLSHIAGFVHPATEAKKIAV